ncbi:MAG: MBL fold metallo-hydrolase [Desulfobacteraceae bacterium]|nr:MBL fold metallo-hydrolase [Desulfobacteraceae bacterium]
MDIVQFRYAADNLGYLVYCDGSAMAVDGGAVDAMLDFIAGQDLQLKIVANTHDHPDHTPGNQALLRRTDAVHLTYRQLIRDKAVRLGGQEIGILETPGHTMDSLCFHAGKYLITGDTLFNGTVGNCFSGDTRAFYNSLKRLMALPADTIIYAGHDYVRESIAIARGIEPENPAFDSYLAAYDSSHVQSTLGEELAVNPYLRFNAEPMVRMLRHKGLRVDTEFERFSSTFGLG